MSLVGAYAAAPLRASADREFHDFVEAVESLDGVTGLEIPYLGPFSPWNTVGYLAHGTPGRRHVLTLLPTFARRLAETPRQGLASTDPAWRRAAIELVRQARDWVLHVNGAGGAQFAAIEIHSAPRHPDSDPSAFADSLAEIAGWDWAGARLLIEHCDAGGLGHTPAKGFLSLDDEVAIARRAGVGMLMNWGRSAIETRSAAGVQEQLEHLAAEGVLKGLIFSGSADQDTDLGAAWADSHEPASPWSESSLLNAVAMAAGLAVVQDAQCDFVGIKVAAPHDFDRAARLKLISAHVGLLRGAAATRLRPTTSD